MLNVTEEIRQKYRNRLILPEFPVANEVIEFVTKSGTIIAKGYERVVIGDRGPYIEFSTSQMEKAWHIPKEQRWRIKGRCYYIECRTNDEANVKIYYQKAEVDYADYKVGMWYISPFDLLTDKYPTLISPLEK